MKLINRILCRILKHKKVFATEYRFRRNKPFWKGESKGRYVLGGYWKCARCGKKLSKFERIW